MSFARAKIKRFNEVTFCSPPVGSYTPKFEGTFPYPRKKSPPSRRPSRAGSVVSFRSHGSNTRPSSRSSNGSSNSEDNRTKCPVASCPVSPKQFQDKAITRTEEGERCKDITPSDKRLLEVGKTKTYKVSEVKVSEVKVSGVKASGVKVCDALEVKSTASTELITYLKNEISQKCFAVETLTLKVEELLTDNRRKANDLEKLVKENQSRTKEMEAVKLQLEKLRSENSRTVEELDRTKTLVKQLRQENRKKTTELNNAKAALEKIPKCLSPTGIPEAKKSKLFQERPQNKSSRLTTQLQRSRVLLRLADDCKNRRSAIKTTENSSESKNSRHEPGKMSLSCADVKSPNKMKFEEDLNPKRVRNSTENEKEVAKVQGIVAQGSKDADDANGSSVANTTKTKAKTETERRQDLTKTQEDKTHQRSSCSSNVNSMTSPSMETPETWKIELEELRKKLNDVDVEMEENVETWLDRDNSTEKRTGQKSNSSFFSQIVTSVEAASRRETKLRSETFRIDNNNNGTPRERTSVWSPSREFPREKVSAYDKRQASQSPNSSSALSQATKIRSSAETVRSYEDFLVISGRGHRLGTNDFKKSRGGTKWRPSVTKTDVDDSEKSFQLEDPVKDLAVDKDNDPDSPARWKKRYEELWTTAQPFRDLLNAFSAQKRMLSDRRRKTREDDSSCVDQLCREFSKVISHEHERRRMKQVVELQKQNSLLKIELDAIRKRRSAPPIITNRSGQQQQQQQQLPQ